MLADFDTVTPAIVATSYAGNKVSQPCGLVQHKTRRIPAPKSVSHGATSRTVGAGLVESRLGIRLGGTRVLGGF
jgi:hypothetical protein